MEALQERLVAAGEWIWGPMVPVVLLAGVVFTVITRGVQLTMLPEMFRTLLDPPLKDEHGNDRSVSTLAAFSISAAGRIGTANVAGVAPAVARGLQRVPFASPAHGGPAGSAAAPVAPAVPELSAGRRAG